MEVAQKIENRVTTGSSNSVSGYITEENESTDLKLYMHPNSHGRSSIIANIWKQHKCPSVDECIKKVPCVCVCVCVYNYIYLICITGIIKT